MRALPILIGLAASPVQATQLLPVPSPQPAPGLAVAVQVAAQDPAGPAGFALSPPPATPPEALLRDGEQVGLDVASPEWLRLVEPWRGARELFSRPPDPGE